MSQIWKRYNLSRHCHDTVHNDIDAGGFWNADLPGLSPEGGNGHPAVDPSVRVRALCVLSYH